MRTTMTQMTIRAMTTLPIVLVALAAVLTLDGCASDQDLKFGPPRDVTGSGEMKPGRGLLTGDSGEWTIFRQ